ncbi:hypothetical protein PHYSODRAFT_333112 [Phytophthora sojae]|uniref:Uncharacterized protein n=1 Tax=Phytophthora sojae (strain P6497) TaxID=1094619 RepID=G4ZQ70_PHYSP|nr:hypothetical protein PHYSODRAFT_333068 [Phytophthora sojae]XP_009528530.1 hypothetical protein PHYSODRAFT_333112 [Phytophthora sojae]EGZ14733.1 hypothetical protein PHYSODRAFT_333068 [Phytophthora sojae]EGZ14781.1 hypothetical protein PHYSODRAFT_333112 [Phytophthora sojae]|eukprot:XP_009528482.1 hypothetical protein PHYSODRAFT_333068 [Phytophthora sojae]
MAITQDGMDAISRSVFIPVMLVLDVWVFQNLVAVYYSRRKEFRVRSLLLAALLGFVTQVYSHDNREMALELNDISETSLQLTFVTQITLIGRAVCKKVKLRSIFYFTYTADALGDVLSLIGNVLESTSLIFVIVFRFYYLSLTHGLKTVLEERKFEMFLYVLLVIHEFPFMMLEYYTGVTWEFAQGIGNRVFVVACIVQNIRHKAISSRSSSKSSNKNSTVRSKRYAPAPVQKQLAAPTTHTPALKSTSVKPGSFSTTKIAVTSIREHSTAT